MVGQVPRVRRLGIEADAVVLDAQLDAGVVAIAQGHVDMRGMCMPVDVAQRLLSDPVQRGGDRERNELRHATLRECHQHRVVFAKFLYEVFQRLCQSQVIEHGRTPDLFLSPADPRTTEYIEGRYG